MKNNVKLKDLVGIHRLSGVDFYKKQSGIDVILFIMDGVTYKTESNPDDGYRSFMEDLEISNESVRNIFEPQEVFGTIIGDNEHLIQFSDTTTKKSVLELGTGDWDDYYPYCVMNWIPENLACNIGK